MGDLNQAQIIGRLGRDPDIRTMQSGDRVANLSLATSDRWKDRNTGEQREKTEWHSITVYGNLVDTVERFLRKGARVFIQGTLRTRKWQDQSGNDRWSTEIVLQGFNSAIQIIDWPEGSGRTASQDQQRGELPPGPGDSYPSPGDLDEEISF